MIPFIDFKGSGKELHFLHANGYPPACYSPMLNLLSSRFHTSAMLMRPLWADQQPSSLNDWLPLSRDLLAFLEQEHMQGVIGVGHSIGATVTLRAAVFEPDRFRALVLLDPAFFQPHFILFWKVIKALGLGYRLHPLIPSAQRRRRKFDDLEKLFRAYPRREIFRYFGDDSLRAFIDGMVAPAADGGYNLVHSPEWETQIYYTGISPDMDIWRALPRLSMPILIIRGAETNTFGSGTARQIERIRPETTVIEMEKSTHLVPLEKPREVFETISTFIEGL